MLEKKTGRSTLGLIGAIWGVAGFSIILLDAINRLARIALVAFEDGLSAVQYVVLAIVIIAMAYMEGYRGFQKSFSPRCAARTRYLYERPETLAVLLAPLFLMGFFRATRAPFLFAWVGTALIVILIILLQISPQPWRGIVDCGVVVGLSWGLISFWVSVYQAFSSADYGISPEVPERASV